MNLKFWKYQGTGNDFIMIDNRQNVFISGEKTVSSLCRRRTGIGADGLIIIENHPSLDFSMRYFNADGKEASMCGNGGRCAIAFAKYLGICNNHTAFKAVDGKHEGMVLNDQIRLKMQDVNKFLEMDGDFFLNTGSPHYVTFREDVEHYDVAREGKKIRYSSSFQPEGTNVNFVRIVNDNTLFNRTYERGVEEETLSCGTGSVAAAITLAIKRQNVSSPVTVNTPGGILHVYFTQKKENSFTDIWLEGPASSVFEGTTIISD